MRKIPTLFVRDPRNMKLVIPEVKPGCEWVLHGIGKATRKFDGTCCMIRGGKFYKRFESRPGKIIPEGFEPAQEPDPTTGKQPGWLPVSDSPEDRWHREAMATEVCREDGTYELCGPKVQGNPENFDHHVLVPHGHDIAMDALVAEPIVAFDILKAFLSSADIEGIVWWRDTDDPDCDKVKIKARDFGIQRGGKR